MPSTYVKLLFVNIQIKHLCVQSPSVALVSHTMHVSPTHMTSYVFQHICVPIFMSQLSFSFLNWTTYDPESQIIHLSISMVNLKERIRGKEK